MFRHGHDILPRMCQVHLALPGHDAEDIQRKQNAHRVQLGIGVLQEISDDIGAMPIRVLFLKNEAGVPLIALGRKAHIIKLNFVHSRFGRPLR